MKKETEQLYKLQDLLAPDNLQEDLAKILGISQPMVSQLFNEKVNMGGPLKQLLPLLLRDLDPTEPT